jgi:hypothetical protein
MIDYDLIAQFASVDQTRRNITQPRLVALRLVATCGRILVEVETSEVTGLEKMETVLTEPFPRYQIVLDPAFGPEPHIDMAAPVAPPKPAPRYVEGAPGGEILPQWIATYQYGEVNAYLLERINLLPEVRWFRPNPVDDHYEGCQIPFRFGETGRGCFSPLRRIHRVS